MRPPQPVLDAWGLPSGALPLEGGQGTSLRVGDVVLKPYADDVEVGWFAGLCDRFPAEASVRLPRPVPAIDGRLVVDGWTATRFVAGTPVDDGDSSAEAWRPVLTAGRAFHAAIAAEPEPPHLALRTHRWAVADRAAWGEIEAPHPGAGSRRLLDAARLLAVDEGLPLQLVHGDLSGNVLLAEGLPPAVIDVSPYWRPAAYADAIVVIDALLWWRSDSALLALGQPVGLPTRAWRSLLTRALVFRLLAFDEPHRDRDDVVDQLPRYAEVLDQLDDLD